MVRVPLACVVQQALVNYTMVAKSSKAHARRTLRLCLDLPSRQRGRDLVRVTAHDDESDHPGAGGQCQDLSSRLGIESGNRVAVRCFSVAASIRKADAMPVSNW